MILLETIHNAHQQLGRPTDHETLLKTHEKLSDQVLERCSEIEALLIRTWHKEHPEMRGIRGGEAFERICDQAYRQAEEQIIEEEINEPIRALVQAQLDAGIDPDYDD